MSQKREYWLLKEATCSHNSAAVRHGVVSVGIEYKHRQDYGRHSNSLRYDLRHSWRLNLLQATKEFDQLYKTENMFEDDLHFAVDMEGLQFP
jgi:hypothetical protein